MTHQSRVISLVPLLRSSGEPLNISPTRRHILPEGKQAGSHGVKDGGWKIGLLFTGPMNFFFFNLLMSIVKIA